MKGKATISVDPNQWEQFKKYCEQKKKLPSSLFAKYMESVLRSER